MLSQNTELSRAAALFDAERDDSLAAAALAAGGGELARPQDAAALEAFGSLQARACVPRDDDTT